VEDGGHAVKLSGRGLAGPQVQILEYDEGAIEIMMVEEVVGGTRYLGDMQRRSGVTG
jgi:hypothetical protein